MEKLKKMEMKTLFEWKVEGLQKASIMETRKIRIMEKRKIRIMEKRKVRIVEKRKGKRALEKTVRKTILPQSLEEVPNRLLVASLAKL